MSSTELIGTGSDDSTATADLDLLRSYEPVVRYTDGELFFPTGVSRYAEQCTLWAGTAEGDSELIVPAGGLTLERLAAEGRLYQGRPLYMRFVAKPFRRRAYRRWRRSLSGRFRTGGRLTTTGMLGRFVDAGFRASLFLRGKVPAGVTAAAHTLYREHLEAERFTYYGRVVRDGGYVCLQYWFFYAMDDWRSKRVDRPSRARCGARLLAHAHSSSYQSVPLAASDRGQTAATISASRGPMRTRNRV